VFNYTLALIRATAGYIAGLLAAIPEPLTFLLLGSALVALGFIARRKRSHR